MPVAHAVRHILPISLAAICAASAPPPAAAQPPHDAPTRPRLKAGADTNDWEAYYDHAVSKIRISAREAQAGFYWASRLDPTRAEPLFGQWVAFWLRDFKRWERYLADDKRVLESPEVIRADSLRVRALLRNPFVHQGLRIILYDQLPGRWRDDYETKGWLAYAQGQLPRAAMYFARVIAANPTKNYRVRHHRALALTSMGQYDSALTEMTLLLAEIRRRQQARLVYADESTEFFEYAIGMLNWARNDLGAAKEAMRRAVVENAAFYPAHAGLGDIARAEGDTATAVQEYAQAVELAPGDAAVHFWYGVSLYKARRPADAVNEFREAIRMEPFYADSYVNLGAALEAAGDREGAVAAYREYVARAPRRAADRLALVRQRIESLAGSAAPAVRTP